jgi:hypothetical protein
MIRSAVRDGSVALRRLNPRTQHHPSQDLTSYSTTAQKISIIHLDFRFIKIILNVELNKVKGGPWDRNRQIDAGPTT